MLNLPDATSFQQSSVSRWMADYNARYHQSGMFTTRSRELFSITRPNSLRYMVDLGMGSEIGSRLGLLLDLVLYDSGGAYLEFVQAAGVSVTVTTRYLKVLDGLSMLLAPIILLTLLKGVVAKLVIVSLFLSLFEVVGVAVTKARDWEVVAATAAYVLLPPGSPSVPRVSICPDFWNRYAAVLVSFMQH